MCLKSVSLTVFVSTCLTACHNRLNTGPADERPLSHAQLTAQAAQGHLTRALHKLLTALQPQQQQQQHAVRAVHPGEVLSRLSWYVPAGVLEPGLQQDAAEALEVRMVCTQLYIHAAVCI